MNNRTNNNNNVNNLAWSSSNQLPLSRIHRLIRPLKASIESLKRCTKDHEDRQLRMVLLRKKKNSFYPQRRTNQRDEAWIQDNHREHRHSSRKKYVATKAHRKTSTSTKTTNPISSPIFDYPQNKTKFQNNRRTCILSSNERDVGLEIQTKIEKTILAYKNILDSTILQPPVTHPNHQINRPHHSHTQIDKLTTICARVVGSFIEHAIDLESNPINHRSSSCAHHLQHDHPTEDDLTDSEAQHLQPISLFTELDWKTSVMDEWYDAIPLLYRRYALAQHALKMILLEFPVESNLKQTKRTTTTVVSVMNHPQSLFQAIHSLHRAYNSPLVQPQANSLLPSLFSLPTSSWFEIYDDYSHTFDLRDRFTMSFYSVVDDLSFLEFCSDRELIAFTDLTVYKFGSWVVEKWLRQRESLIKSRMVWRSSQEYRQAGLESSDPDDLDSEITEDAIVEYDKQTSSILIQWIQSLVMNCLPHSIHCNSARTQLNAISRLIFDSLMAFNPDACSKADNYFLSLISVTIESHRLALFGLPMFNTGSIDRSDQMSEWSSVHTPMRLQALIPKVVTNLDQKIFNKAAKLFFRAHRSTRLLAILPGLLSARHQPIIPGLHQLLEFVIKREYSIEFVAKTWVESLLKSDPKSWWIEADSNTTSANSSTASEEDDGIRSKGAQDVRTWLENWLPMLEAAEKLRSNVSDHDLSDDHHNQSESDNDDQRTFVLVSKPSDLGGQQHPPEDIKPPVTCTCSSNTHQQLVQPTVCEDDEAKPNVAINPTDSNDIIAAESNENIRGENVNPAEELTQTTAAAASSSHNHNHHIKVLVPTTKKRKRKSGFLSLPSTRSKTKRNKSTTPSQTFPRTLPISASSSSRSTSINSDHPPLPSTTTCDRNEVSLQCRTRQAKRCFHSSVFPLSHQLEDKRSVPDDSHASSHDAHLDETNDQDDDDEDDGFDAMDLLVSSHRLKTPVQSFTSSSVNTSGTTLVNHGTSSTRRKK